MPKHRVLIVDDYPDAAEVASTLLTIMGHECRIAVSGAQAIEEARAFGPDIAILDIGLPDRDGYEVASALRALFAGRELFLVALTGWGDPEDRDRALAAGFDLHVVKPTNAQKLGEIVAAFDALAGNGP